VADPHRPSAAPAPLPVIVECVELSKHFATAVTAQTPDLQRTIQAVDRASLQIFRGEILGLWGESGCGKSTLGRLLARLDTPSEGEVFFNGHNVTRIRGADLRKWRSDIQITFQAAAASLHPRYTVQETIFEALKAHRKRQPKAALYQRALALLSQVGLPHAMLQRRPAELSSGEKQRLVIARALAIEPQFLIADEPIAQLDITSQQQVLALLHHLQQELGITILLITNDLNTVRRNCHRTAIMHQGRLVEIGDTDTLFRQPAHPYTRAIIAAQKIHLRSALEQSAAFSEDEPLAPPALTGCRFAPHCPHADDICRQAVPNTREVRPRHFVKCHFDFET